MNSINETFTGYWAIPTGRTKTWNGTLSFTSENRILLSFVCTLNELKEFAPEIFAQVHSINNQKPIPIIIGLAKNSLTNKDLKFTLVDLELVEYSQSDLISITLEAKYCLNLYQVKDDKQLIFSSLMLKFEGIDRWMDKNGFQVKNPEDNDSKVFTNEIKFQQPESIELFENDNVRIYFYFRARSPGFLVIGPKAVIEQSLYLNIEFKTPIQIEDLNHYIEKIQNLFTLINTYPTQKTGCQVKYYPNKGSNIDNHTVDFLYKERVSKPKGKINEGTFLFTYSEMEDKFDIIFKKWLILYQNYEPALDQYFDTLYFNEGHVVSRFVNILSVLEIYHSRKFSKKINLNQKITSLIEQFNSLNIRFFHFSKEFVDEVILIRKYYVHGTHVQSKTTNQMVQKENISKLIRSLENIFRINILMEIGLTEDDVSRIIERKPWQWNIKEDY